DLAVAVAHDHQGGEREPAAALHDLGHAVDRDHTLLELRLGAVIPAWAAPVVTGRPVSLLSTGTPARGWCHAECLLRSSSEIQAALAGRLGQGANTSLVLEATAVEHHRGDAGRLGLGRQLGPDPGGGGLLVAVAGRGRRPGGGQGAAGPVVDELGVDLLVGAEDGQARPLGRAHYPPPHATVTPQARVALHFRTLHLGPHFAVLPGWRRTCSPA